MRRRLARRNVISRTMKCSCAGPTSSFQECIGLVENTPLFVRESSRDFVIRALPQEKNVYGNFPWFASSNIFEEGIGIFYYILVSVRLPHVARLLAL
jgi:hypothetical protein